MSRRFSMMRIVAMKVVRSAVALIFTAIGLWLVVAGVTIRAASALRRELYTWQPTDDGKRRRPHHRPPRRTLALGVEGRARQSRRIGQRVAGRRLLYTCSRTKSVAWLLRSSSPAHFARGPVSGVSALANRTRVGKSSIGSSQVSPQGGEGRVPAATARLFPPSPEAGRRASRRPGGGEASPRRGLGGDKGFAKAPKGGDASTVLASPTDRPYI